MEERDRVSVAPPGTGEPRFTKVEEPPAPEAPEAPMSDAQIDQMMASLAGGTAAPARSAPERNVPRIVPMIAAMTVMGLVLVIGALTMAKGKEGGSSAPQATPAVASTLPGEEGARATLVAFTDALAAGKYDDACSLMSASARQQIEGFGPCATVFSGTMSEVADKDGLGEKARNTTLTMQGDAASSGPLFDETDNANLVREGGRWLIGPDS